MKEPWIIHRLSVHRYLPRFSALSINPHELSMTIPLFFHNRRVSSFCESHFFSPFWWRSFRRFCPLVICTVPRRLPRFERGPKHVAQRWGIEADGFVGNANKTSKPHTEMCKTTHLFQSFFYTNVSFFLLLVFVDAKRKYQPGMPSAKNRNTKKRCSEVVSFYGTRFHSSGFLQIRCVDLGLVNGTVS